MRAIRGHLSYSNIVATVALFIALGGASYAAIQLPSSSVGTKQLKKAAVSTKKIQNGAVTGDKIADGSISGAKVDLATLGTVPNAVSATKAGAAAHAERATQATRADFATESKGADFLDGRSGEAYGTALVAHTEIPATTEDVELWIPVNGMGQARDSLEEVEMLTPSSTSLFATGFTVFSRTGPSPGDAAKVRAQLHYFGNPVMPELPVTRIGYEYWGSGNQIVKIGPGGRLAIKIIEDVNGEEIPALSLQTALYLSPVP